MQAISLCFETALRMHIPRGKSFVFDSFFSVIIIQTNVETKSKKTPPMEIRAKKLT